MLKLLDQVSKKARHERALKGHRTRKRLKAEKERRARIRAAANGR